MYATTPVLWPLLAVFIALGVPLLIHDARSKRLPLPLNLGLLGSAVVGLPLTALWLDPRHLVSALTAAAIITAIALITFIIARGGFGFGDVILVAGLGLYGGYVSILAALTGLWIGSILTLAWMLWRRHRGIHGTTPYGPGLIIGTALAMVIPSPF